MAKNGIPNCLTMNKKRTVLYIEAYNNPLSQDFSATNSIPLFESSYCLMDIIRLIHFCDSPLNTIGLNQLLVRSLQSKVEKSFIENSTLLLIRMKDSSLANFVNLEDFNHDLNKLKLMECLEISEEGILSVTSTAVKYLKMFEMNDNTKKED